MDRRSRMLWAMALIVLGSMVLAPTSPAPARGGTLEFTGTGTNSPGLDLVPAPQNIFLSGLLSGDVVVTDSLGVPQNYSFAAVNCSFSGGSGPTSPWQGDDLTQGSGSLSGGCSGTAVALPGGVVSVNASCPDLVYVRISSSVSLQGACRVSSSAGSGSVGLQGEFHATATSAPPVTSFAVSGVVTVV